MSISWTSLLFYCTSKDYFSALAKFDSLKLIKFVADYVTTVCISFFEFHIFQEKKKMCFTSKASMKPMWGSRSCSLFFMEEQQYSLQFRSAWLSSSRAFSSLVNLNLIKTILHSIYLIFLYFLLFTIIEFRASVKIQSLKRSKHKDKHNHLLVLTTEILLSTFTTIYLICKRIHSSLLM